MKTLLHFLTCLSLPFVIVNGLHADEPTPKKPSNSAWLEEEYIYWWIKDSPATIPLVTKGPSESKQKLVLGGHGIDNEARSGGKFSAGYLFGSDQVYGVDAGYLFLNRGSYTKTVSSNGKINSPILEFPYFDVLTSLSLPTSIKQIL